MDRRLFLVISVAGLIAIPFDSEAQRTARHRVVGFVSSGLSSHWAKGGSLAHLRSAFEDAFRDTGYAVGQDVEIYYRFAEGDSAKLSLLTADLITRSTDVLVVAGPAALRVAQAATTRIPIVATDFEDDPVEAGFAQSLARPGGNVTGAFLERRAAAAPWVGSTSAAHDCRHDGARSWPPTISA